MRHGGLCLFSGKNLVLPIPGCSLHIAKALQPPLHIMHRAVRTGMSTCYVITSH